MSAGDSAVNSEIFGRPEPASADYDRSGSCQFCAGRGHRSGRGHRLVNDLKSDQRLNMDASRRNITRPRPVPPLPIEYLGIIRRDHHDNGKLFCRHEHDVRGGRAAAPRKSARCESWAFRAAASSRLPGGIAAAFRSSGDSRHAFWSSAQQCARPGIGSFTTFSEIAFNFRHAGHLLGRLWRSFMGAIRRFFPARNAHRRKKSSGFARNLEFMESELKSLRIDRSASVAASRLPGPPAGSSRAS